MMMMMMMMMKLDPWTPGMLCLVSVDLMLTHGGRAVTRTVSTVSKRKSISKSLNSRFPPPPSARAEVGHGPWSHGGT
jgi:hypothetical protein